MEDGRIIELYFSRNEDAIRETDKKYGGFCRGIAHNILSIREDAEECTNDTYLAAWNAMPDERPTFLGAFLSKIIRRISIDRFRHDHRQKRGGMGAQSVIEELTDCIPDTAQTPAEEVETNRLSETIDRFLAGLSDERRALFINRYFYAVPIAELAHRTGMTDANVKVIL